MRNLGEACVVVRNLREDKANLPEKKTGTANGNGNGNEDGKRYSSIATLSRPCTGYTATLQSQSFINVIVWVHMLASCFFPDCPSSPRFPFIPQLYIFSEISLVCIIRFVFLFNSLVIFSQILCSRFFSSSCQLFDSRFYSIIPFHWSFGVFCLACAGMYTLPAVMCTDFLSACNSVSSVNFGRLKSQRVRLFGRKFSRKKQDCCDYYDLIVEDEPLSVLSSSQSEPEFAEGKKRLDLLRCRCVSRGSQSPETKNTRHKWTKGDMSESEVAVMSGVKLPSKRQDASVSRGSLSSLRRWGDGGSARNIQYNARDKVKEWGNLPSDSGFFSKKSFRDLRCDDTIIESLRNQSIIRPSCIQVRYHSVLWIIITTVTTNIFLLLCRGIEQFAYHFVNRMYIDRHWPLGRYVIWTMFANLEI